MRPSGHSGFGPLQAVFAAALLDPAAPTPAGLAAEPAAAPQKRFAVYRNNVVHGLVSALQTRFPVVEAIVGAEFFAAMAHAYVAGHPPRSKLMMHYGEDFPDFIARFAPAAALPYLPDVARLEAARTRACHAADATPVAAQALAGLPADVLPALRLTLHPSVQVVSSPHPIVTIWAMNTGALPLAPIGMEAPEDALIARPALTVEVRLLPPGGAGFVRALAAGATLADAAARSDHSDFDLARTLATLLAAGAIAGLHHGSSPS